MKNKEGEWCRCLVTVAAVGGRWPATMGGRRKTGGKEGSRFERKWDSWPLVVVSGLFRG